MSKKKTSRKIQNSVELQKERRKAVNTASYLGIAIASALIIITVIIIWAVNFVPNKVCFEADGYQIKRNVYECCYFYNSAGGADWSTEGYEAGKNPYAQEMDFETADGTFDSWGDYFQFLTADTLSFCCGMVNKAEKNGYEFSDKISKDTEKELQEIEDKANQEQCNFRAYMYMKYGAEIRKKDLREFLTLYNKALDYYDSLTENESMFLKDFHYEKDDIDSTYSKISNDWDVVTLRYFQIEADESALETVNALKTCKDENAFKKICNANATGDKEEYAEQDKSLFKNYSLSALKPYLGEKVYESISSNNVKPGDILTDERKLSGKNCYEVYYIVSPRAANTENYNDSNVPVWKYNTIAYLIDEYCQNNVESEEKSDGIEVFKDNIYSAPETTESS